MFRHHAIVSRTGGPRIALGRWALTLALMAQCVGFAAQPVPVGLRPPSMLQESNPANSARGNSEQALSWDTGTGKSYSIPALGVAGFDFLLNQFNRNYIDRSVYGSNLSTFGHNLTSKWVLDNDPFSTNQFLHPYQGSMFHGFARSAGLSYWESVAYTVGGSALWETAGETTLPSKNDLIATGIGGTFLGESLFRLANLWLEKGDAPRFWRELGAAVISPSTGFNRIAFGDRFSAVFPSRDPAIFTRLGLGATVTTQNLQGVSQNLERKEAIADFSIDYGLPGKPDYAYRRPFDYFRFEFTAASGNVFENIMTRGLLFGTDYEAGNNYRGIWGLYGSYDYIAPQIFRVSSTALSLGTTAQWRLSDSIVLQGTGLVGAGYGAAGTIHGAGERDYHYGLTPQALLALRVIFGKRAAFDMTARDYYVSRVFSTESRGWENVARADTSFTWRVHGRHAVSVRYVWSRRDAYYSDLGERIQSRGTIGIFYTLLGDTRFGTVDWRVKGSANP